MIIRFTTKKKREPIWWFYEYENVHHVYNINENSNILIRCYTTDVFVIVLGHMEHLTYSSNIWINVGDASTTNDWCITNTRRIKNVFKAECCIGCALYNKKNISTNYAGMCFLHFYEIEWK